MGTSSDIVVNTVGDLQTILEAIASPVRREILWRVWDEELTVGEIAAAFDLTGPTISSHLATLRAAELVVMERDGNFRRYRARKEVLRAVYADLAPSADKWTPADDLPEAKGVAGQVAMVVTAAVHVSVGREAAFSAFVNDALYSAWMGVPVTLVDGQFSCTLEWGTVVRGIYDVVAPPLLIAMRWDLDDGAVPLPGGELIGYLRFFAVDDSSTRVEVHQLVASVEQARLMEAAWTMVLGRFQEGAVRALASESTPRRPARPKRISKPAGNA